MLAKPEHDEKFLTFLKDADPVTVEVDNARNMLSELQSQ